MILPSLQICVTENSFDLPTFVILKLLKVKDQIKMVLYLPYSAVYLTTVLYMLPLVSTVGYGSYSKCMGQLAMWCLA